MLLFAHALFGMARQSSQKLTGGNMKQLRNSAFVLTVWATLGAATLAHADARMPPPSMPSHFTVELMDGQAIGQWDEQANVTWYKFEVEGGAGVGANGYATKAVLPGPIDPMM